MFTTTDTPTLTLAERGIDLAAMSPAVKADLCARYRELLFVAIENKNHKERAYLEQCVEELGGQP